MFFVDRFFPFTFFSPATFLSSWSSHPYLIDFCNLTSVSLFIQIPATHFPFGVYTEFFFLFLTGFLESRMLLNIIILLLISDTLWLPLAVRSTTSSPRKQSQSKGSSIMPSRDWSIRKLISPGLDSANPSRM